ncbi:hypothetical protein D3C73_993890 [compost metagenome]
MVQFLVCERMILILDRNVVSGFLSLLFKNGLQGLLRHMIGGGIVKNMQNLVPLFVRQQTIPSNLTLRF